MIKVWGRMTSTNVQKVMWCIDELGVEHEHIDIPHGGARQDAAYLAMNPNGLVPTIEDDGFVLWESNSCVRYIAAKFGAGTLWPKDLCQRADAERWMDWQLTTLSAPGWTIFLGLVLTKPEQRDLAAIAAATKRFNELWTIVDKVLATRKFVAGDELTIGDIPIGIAAYRWFTIPAERDHHPNFEAWYARLTERAAFKKNVMAPLLLGSASESSAPGRSLMMFGSKRHRES
jgi:glutathione S-transferase